MLRNPQGLSNSAHEIAALGDELEIQLRRLESDDESVDGEVNESESNSISDTH